MHSTRAVLSALNRRQFFQRSTLAASALAFPFVSSRKVLGANARLNIAAIGAGGKGRVDIGYCKAENVVALRTGKRIEWDAEKLRVTNVAEANQFIRPPYRKGWESPV